MLIKGVLATHLSSHTGIPSLTNSVAYDKLLSHERYHYGMPVTDYAAHPFSAQNYFPEANHLQSNGRTQAACSNTGSQGEQNAVSAGGQVAGWWRNSTLMSFMTRTFQHTLLGS